MTVRWKSLKGGAGASKRLWSGPHVAGVTPFEAPLDPESHAQRAVWLSSQLEAPSWGSVQGYDGCGMSAGLLHNTAVLPNGGRPVQGRLWSLVDAMHKHPNAASASALKPYSAAIAARLARSPPGGAVDLSGTIVYPHADRLSSKSYPIVQYLSSFLLR